MQRLQNIMLPANPTDYIITFNVTGFTAESSRPVCFRRDSESIIIIVRSQSVHKHRLESSQYLSTTLNTAIWIRRSISCVFLI